MLVWCIIWAFKFCIQVINTKEKFMCQARWLSDAFSLKYALSATLTSNYVLKQVHGWVISFYP